MERMVDEKRRIILSAGNRQCVSSNRTAAQLLMMFRQVTSFRINLGMEMGAARGFCKLSWLDDFEHEIQCITNNTMKWDH
jgi:hypothetical protein